MERLTADGILDKLNVEICLANRAMMPAYLNTKRFHWVFFGICSSTRSTTPAKRDALRTWVCMYRCKKKC